MMHLSSTLCQNGIKHVSNASNIGTRHKEVCPSFISTTLVAPTFIQPKNDYSLFNKRLGTSLVISC